MSVKKIGRTWNAMQKANKIIYSLRVNIELLKRGFVPIVSMPNPTNNKWICWVYEKTDNFDKALDEIMGGMSNG